MPKANDTEADNADETRAQQAREISYERSVLLFPAGVSDCLRFAAMLRDPDRTVVGASSLAEDPARSFYRRWATLPFVTDPNFPAALADLIEREHIASVFCPSPVVWKYLDTFLAEIAPAVDLLNAAPLEIERRRQNMVDRRVASCRTAHGILFKSHSVDDSLLRTILHTADGIHGQCNDDKIAGLAEAIASAPGGDVVEIGTYMGKSATALLLAARAYDVGSVLCIDPWSVDAAHQHDADPMVGRLSDSLDWDFVFQRFQTELSRYANGDIGYLRAKSMTALDTYAAFPATVRTVEFGPVPFMGEIALLHIDGNHDNDAVLEDIMGWSPYVRPGGWIVIDDYEWSLSDGPRIAGDWFRKKYRDHLSCAFVRGTALFCRTKHRVGAVARPADTPYAANRSHNAVIVLTLDGRGIEESADLLRAALAKKKIVHIVGQDFGCTPTTNWNTLLSRLGELVAQGEDGATGRRNGSKWIDVRFDTDQPHTFRHHNSAQPLHTDGAYNADSPAITFFLCARQAKAGGASLFADAADIAAVCRQQDAELFHFLTAVNVDFSKFKHCSSGRPILFRQDGDWRIRWNSYRVASDQSEQIIAGIERFNVFLEEYFVRGDGGTTIDLRPGEAILFDDRKRVHGRSAFEAVTTGERLIWKCALDLRDAL